MRTTEGTRRERAGQRPGRRADGGPGSRASRACAARGLPLRAAAHRARAVVVAGGRGRDLQAAGSYRSRAGSVLRRCGRRGRAGSLVMPLGPAGEFALQHAPHAGRHRHGLPAAGGDRRPAGRPARRASCPRLRGAAARDGVHPLPGGPRPVAAAGRRGRRGSGRRPPGRSAAPALGAPLGRRRRGALLLGGAFAAGDATRPSTARRPSSTAGCRATSRACCRCCAR